MKTKVLIIGAGPYGIAVAHELWRRGVDMVVAGEPFELWHGNTLSSMRLRSDCRASEIYTHDGRYRFTDYLRNQGSGQVEDQTPVSTFRAYLHEVTEQLPFPIVRQRITELIRTGDQFHARGDGAAEISAAAVVVATGIGTHRYLPQALRALPGERVIHSWESDRIEDLCDQRVLVIGGGQSAAEAVAHLKDRNRVTWALRRPPFFCREPLRLPTPLFKTLMTFSRGFYRLPPPAVKLLTSAVFRTTVTPTLRAAYRDPQVSKVQADADDLDLHAGPEGLQTGAAGETFDWVVSATGYRFSLRGLPFFAGDLRRALGPEDRAPELDGHLETTVPNLFLTGGITEPTFGPAMRFILGSRHTAERLGATLEKRCA